MKTILTILIMFSVLIGTIAIKLPEFLCGWLTASSFYLSQKFLPDFKIVKPDDK